MAEAPSIRIRPAGAADAPALRAILNDTLQSTWGPQLTAAAAEKLAGEDRPGQYVAARGERFFVAEVAGEVVGLVDWEGDFVNALHVRGSHARQGLGARLMDVAEAAIREAGFAAARLETDTFNTGSRAFYAARGWVEIDRYPDTEWDSGLTTLLLAKTFR